MVATLAFLALTTVAPSNLYVFSDASKLKKLLAEGHKVLPSCGAIDCLGMNPKASHLNGVDSNRKANAKAEKEGPAA